jgi:hypothetical protein
MGQRSGSEMRAFVEAPLGSLVLEPRLLRAKGTFPVFPWKEFDSIAVNRAATTISLFPPHQYTSPVLLTVPAFCKDQVFRLYSREHFQRSLRTTLQEGAEEALTR